MLLPKAYLQIPEISSSVLLQEDGWMFSNDRRERKALEVSLVDEDVDSLDSVICGVLKKAHDRL